MPCLVTISTDGRSAIIGEKDWHLSRVSDVIRYLQIPTMTPFGYCLGCEILSFGRKGGLESKRITDVLRVHLGVLRALIK